MSNSFYNPGGTPATRSGANSAPMRAEFAAIGTAFDKFPTLSGNPLKVLRINGASGAIEAVPALTVLTPVANVPMAGFKHTGAAAGIAGGEYLVFGQNGAELASLTVSGVATLNSGSSTVVAATRMGFGAVSDVATVRGVTVANYGVTYGGTHTDFGGPGLALAGYHGMLLVTGGLQRAWLNLAGELGLGGDPVAGTIARIKASGTNSPLRLALTDESGTVPALVTANDTAGGALQAGLYHSLSNILFGNLRAGSLSLFTDSQIRMTIAADGSVSMSGVLTASGFSGPLTGNVTGNVSGSSGSCTGNAATATFATTAGSATTATNAANATNAVNATNLVTPNGTLSDYQVGTFSPTVSLSAGAPTYIEQTGKFTRIGNVVFFTATVRWSGGNNGASVNSVGGLPFSSAAALQPVSIVPQYNGTLGLTWGSDSTPVAYLNGSASVQIAAVNPAATLGAVQQFAPADKDLVISGSYQIA